MSTSSTAITFDPASLTAFAASLSSLPQEEIKKAKRLFIKNAIADFDQERVTGKTMMMTLGVMSIIPIFLIIFIPALISYRNGIKTGRQKIRNAIEIWRDDLGDDADATLRELR